MPKVKTRRGAAKRMTLSKSGKIKRHKAYKSHLLTSKSPKRKRGLRKATEIASTDMHRARKMLAVG